MSVYTKAGPNTRTTEYITYGCLAQAINVWAMVTQAADEQKLEVYRQNVQGVADPKPVLTQTGSGGTGAPNYAGGGHWVDDTNPDDKEYVQSDGQVWYQVHISVNGKASSKLYNFSNVLLDGKLNSGNLCVESEDGTDNDYNDTFVSLSWMKNGD